MRWSHRFVIFLIAFAAVSLIPSIYLARTNRENLRTLRKIDIAQIDLPGRLTLRNPQEISSEDWQTPQAACMRIWQGRVWASYDLKKASESLADSEKCRRSPDLTTIWRGNFAFLSGDLVQAGQFWRKVPDEILLTYAKNLILNGETQIGLPILAVLAERTGTWADDPKKIDLLVTLGDLFRYGSEANESSYYYQQAWDAGARSYGLAFYLGKVLRSERECTRAVKVLNEGLDDREFAPEIPTQLDLSYYEELGSCYLTLGQMEAAREAHDHASQILANGQKSWPPEMYFQRLERFKRIFAAIDGK